MSYRLTNPYTVALAAVAGLVFVLAAVTARYRSKRAATPLAGLFLCAGVWTLGDALRIAAPTESHVLFWNRIAYVGIAFIPVPFVTFVAALTNRERWLRPRYLYGMLLVSAGVVAVVATNHLHGLWRAGEVVTPGTAPPVLDERRGPLWYVWVPYVYVLVLSAMFFLAREFSNAHRSKTYRTQVGLVILGSVVALASTATFLVGVVPFDVTPVGFAAMSVVFAVAIFRYQLLDIAPIARDVVVENVDTGVLVLDTDEVVVDANERARTVLDLDEDAVPGVDLRSALAAFPDLADGLGDLREPTGTVSVDTGEVRRDFEVEVSPITDELGTYIGRVVVFSDVTERIRRERDLQNRTERLRERNERLDELATMVNHDLRNPLDVSAHRVRRLRTLIEDLDLEPDIASDVQSELSGIERATDRAAEISEDLLTISSDVTGPRDPDSSGESVDGSDSDQQSSPDQSPTVSLRSVATAALEAVETGELELTISGSGAIAAEEGALRRLLEHCYRTLLAQADGATAVVVGVTRDGFYVEEGGDGYGGDDTGGSRDPYGRSLPAAEEVAADQGWSVEVGESESGGTRLTVRTGPD